MPTAIEITDTDIRLCRIEGGRLSVLEAYPLSADADPIAALAAAPLPRPLGPVRVAIGHQDMLLRTMLQPPSPMDRLARIIRFELQDLAGGDDDGTMINWHCPAVPGDDMRVIVQICKRRLIDALGAALAEHQGKLQGLVDPAVAMYEGWRRDGQKDQGNRVLVDCGPRTIRMAFLFEGDLIFFRAQRPGMHELTEAVMQLRGVDADNAERLIRKLGSNPPKDLVGLIEKQCANVATAIQNNVRFARTQLKLREYELASVTLSGKGARLPNCCELISAQLGVPVSLNNPFAGLTFDLPVESLDDFSQLPSTWDGSIGLAAAEQPLLDGLHQLREERKAWLASSGALRIGAIAAVALMLIALGTQFVRMQVQGSTIEVLHGDGSGMVAVATREEKKVTTTKADKATIDARIEWLAHSRRSGAVAVELLNVISRLQDPDKLPVYIRSYGLRHNNAGHIEVELSGFAEDGQRTTSSEVLGTFETLLKRQYPVIARIDPRDPGGLMETRLPFRWVITIPGKA